MLAKEKDIKRYFFCLILICLLFIIIFFYIRKINTPEIYATTGEKIEVEEVKISQAKKIDALEILSPELTKCQGKVEIYEKNEELEYMTKYINNSNLYIGTTKVTQEGKNGIQTITFKKIIDSDGNVINEEQVNCKVTKSSIDKIVEVGSKKNDRNYKRC